MMEQPVNDDLLQGFLNPRELFFTPFEKPQRSCLSEPVRTAPYLQVEPLKVAMSKPGRSPFYHFLVPLRGPHVIKPRSSIQQRVPFFPFSRFPPPTQPDPGLGIFFGR